MDLSQQELQSLEEKVSHAILPLGKDLLTVWQTTKKVSYKTRFEPVTQYDPLIEEKLRQQLREILPRAGFIVEEGESTEQKDYMWTIDPIDGTNNFKGQIPLFYIQVALCYKSEPILGAIYNPVTDQLFSASKGNGAKINGETITHQTVEMLEKAFIDMDFGAHNNGLYWKLPIFKVLCENCNRLRSSGGGFSPYIAFGGIDAFVVLNERTKLVDQMPRIIWMKELGLTVEQFEIRGHKVTLATNHTLFPKIKSFIVSAIEK